VDSLYQPPFFSKENLQKILAKMDLPRLLLADCRGRDVSRHPLFSLMFLMCLAVDVAHMALDSGKMTHEILVVGEEF
jgi:hypothetical protein